MSAEMREHRERTQCSTVQNMSKGGCADIQSRLPVKVAVCIVIHLTLKSHTVLESAISSPCPALSFFPCFGQFSPPCTFEAGLLWIWGLGNKLPGRIGNRELPVHRMTLSKHSQYTGIRRKDLGASRIVSSYYTRGVWKNEYKHLKHIYLI